MPPVAWFGATVAAGALQVSQYHATLAFVAMRVIKALEHPADVCVSLAIVFFVNPAEADLRRCFEKVLQLRNRAQLGFVHVDHHPWMINLLAIAWPTGVALGSFLGGNSRAAQAHTSLDKAVPCVYPPFEGSQAILSTKLDLPQAWCRVFCKAPVFGQPFGRNFLNKRASRFN
ncbi:MAG: hypothetical protein IPN53_13450 [Comamonadaceae bacterium]|nr:hypothetical protein [Comamonadaceae bacterium]